MSRAVFALVLAAMASACGAEGPPGPQCDVGITFSPADAITGVQVRATAVVTNGVGVLDYDWQVRHAGADVAFTSAQTSSSQAIVFTPAEAGTYDVRVSIVGASCPDASSTLNVMDDNPHGLSVRLHVTPPPDLDVPPLDKRLSISGGGDVDISPVTLERGVRASGSVVSAGAGVSAYLRLVPAGMPDAPVETFSDATGAFSARVLDAPHDVLVIPTDETLAPQIFAGWNPGDPPLELATGQTVSGTVRDSANIGVANAKVQLVIGGVPSAIGTTTATGAFTLHAASPPGADVTVTVTPPAATGLPRLVATNTFAVNQALTVRYASFPIRNLGGVHVRRGGVAQPGARVSLVGEVASEGTITDGSLTSQATAVIRATIIADGAGALPPTAMPGLTVTAVVAVSPSDLAVSSPIALGTAVPADIVVPAMSSFTSRAQAFVTGVAIPGVTLELLPIGDLAAAGAPTLRFTGDATGQITGLLPTGGHYDARWSDAEAIGAPFVDPDVSAQTIASMYVLPKPLFVTGTLSVPGNPNPVPRAAVQILPRTMCTGVACDRPIAEAATDDLGTFSLAVPDPGTR